MEQAPPAPTHLPTNHPDPGDNVSAMRNPIGTHVLVGNGLVAGALASALASADASADALGAKTLRAPARR